VSPQGGDSTSSFRAWSGRAPWIQARPPDARRRAPLPGLAPEGGPGHYKPSRFGYKPLPNALNVNVNLNRPSRLQFTSGGVVGIGRCFTASSTPPEVLHIRARTGSTYRTDFGSQLSDPIFSSFRWTLAPPRGVISELLVHVSHSLCSVLSPSSSSPPPFPQRQHGKTGEPPSGRNSLPSAHLPSVELLSAELRNVFYHITPGREAA